VEERPKLLGLLKADPEVSALMPYEELESLFNEQYYLRYIDDVFKRLGLTKTQWKNKSSTSEPTELAPRAI
jgi:adenylosuccinate lyase